MRTMCRVDENKTLNVVVVAVVEVVVVEVVVVEVKQYNCGGGI